MKNNITLDILLYIPRRSSKEKKDKFTLTPRPILPLSFKNDHLGLERKSKFC